MARYSSHANRLRGTSSLGMTRVQPTCYFVISIAFFHLHTIIVRLISRLSAAEVCTGDFVTRCYRSRRNSPRILALNVFSFLYLAHGDGWIVRVKLLKTIKKKSNVFKSSIDRAQIDYKSKINILLRISSNDNWSSNFLINRDSVNNCCPYCVFYVITIESCIFLTLKNQVRRKYRKVCQCNFRLAIFVKRQRSIFVCETECKIEIYKFENRNRVITNFM